ncbi:DMT family transporter [Lacihabitans soyangensis]|uniref:DMT family transporter n=1 Tax=Lacihabitans soyangensis TaxID=869394 RepID=A0AAE3H0C0_9BACT|nr:DMT family transporter [Lacihabitans soyangensis]MCP9762342.1 DMT family transporter [Lacihabitans soyangensis]
MSITNFQFTKGIKYMLISTFCFSAMQSLVKYSTEIPIFEHIFFRSIIGWLLCVFFLKRERISLIGKNNKMLLFRGLVGSGSMFSFFYLLSRIPFGTAVAFKYLSPVFTTVLAVLILKEKLKLPQWFFLFLSFSGILLVKGFDPRISFTDLTIGLLAAFSGGLLFIIIRKIGEDDHHLVILHYFMLISTIISGVLCFDNFVWPNLFQASIILVIGLIGFTAQNFFTIAIQQQDQVSFLSILRYTEAIYALVIGYIWFNESYSYLSMLGMFMIFLGVILSMIYKSNLKKAAIENIN